MSASADESADAPEGSSLEFPADTRFLPFVLFALSPLIAFPAAMFRAGMMDGGDDKLGLLPFLLHSARKLLAGEIFWTSDLFMGMPVLGEPGRALGRAAQREHAGDEGGGGDDDCGAEEPGGGGDAGFRSDDRLGAPGGERVGERDGLDDYVVRVAAAPLGPELRAVRRRDPHGLHAGFPHECRGLGSHFEAGDHEPWDVPAEEHPSTAHGDVGPHTEAPAAQHREVQQLLRTRVREIKAQFDQVMSRDLEAYKALLRQRNIQHVIIS